MAAAATGIAGTAVRCARSCCENESEQPQLSTLAMCAACRVGTGMPGERGRAGACCSDSLNGKDL